MRDKYGVSNDPYCRPGTIVLRNTLDIRDDATLADAEAEFAAIALEHILIDAPPFDLAYLCSLHRQLFGEVYEWAGLVRTVDISKGRTRFCTTNRIVPEAERILQALASRDLSTLPYGEAIPLVAEVFGELNLVHPFRDGNGRALRLFFEHLLIFNGYAVDWSKVEREEWIAACIAAVHCDYSPLETVLDRCVDVLTPGPDPHG